MTFGIDLSHIQKRFRQCVTLCHTIVTNVSHNCYKCVTQLLQMCHTIVTDVSHNCYKCVTQLLQMCHTLVTNVSHTCYKCVTQLLQMCHDRSCDCVKKATLAAKRLKKSAGDTQNMNKSKINLDL